MITLESLSSDRYPVLTDLDLVVRPQELPVVVCPDDEERVAFVNLLQGLIPETSGQFLHDDRPLSAPQRRAQVIVLRRGDSLEEHLSPLENLEMVAAVGGLQVDADLRQRLLEFAHIPNGKAAAAKLTPESRLRFSVALNVLGDPALIIALDPPREMVAVLGDLLDDHRALLLVVPTAAGLNTAVSQVHTLQHGRLDQEGAGELNKAPGRRYRLRLGPASSADVTLKSLLGTYPGVTISALGKGMVRLDLESEVAATRVIRLMVQAGINLEAIDEDLGRA